MQPSNTAGFINILLKKSLDSSKDNYVEALKVGCCSQRRRERRRGARRARRFDIPPRSTCRSQAFQLRFASFHSHLLYLHGIDRDTIFI